jgi:hypothetical protein
LEARNVFEALQLAVSPVILISAYGLLLLSMTNRLGRAIDRARQLVREGSAKEEQIAIIARRAVWIRSAIVFTSLALALIAAALLVLVLFLSVHLTINISAVVVLLFTGSIAFLIIGLVYFLLDLFGSLRAMKADLLASSHHRPGSGGH